MIEYVIGYVITPAGIFWSVTAILGGAAGVRIWYSKMSSNIAKYLTDSGTVDEYGHFGKN